MEPAPTASKLRNYPDYKSILKIADALRDAVVKGPDGRNEYRQPLNDGALADRLGVSPSTVKNVRRRMYGKIKQWRNVSEAKPAAPKVDRFAEIDRKLDEILKILGRLM